MSPLSAHERERLLMLATSRSRSELVSAPALSEEERAEFDELVGRRLSGEPLQYLEGTVEFGPVTLRVDRRALIPRPETEQLYDVVTRLLRDAPPAIIVDLCTGSGNLALALKHDFPKAHVIGCDESVEALELAAENSALVGLDVEWQVGDLFEALSAGLSGSVDVVVSNPPYVAAGESLPPEVANHEPTSALFAGHDGLDVLRRIAAEAGEWLRPGGLVACEIGADQGAAVGELFLPFEGRVGKDLAGRDRWFIGKHR